MGEDLAWLSRLRAARVDGRTQSVRYRQNQLKALHECLIAHASEIKPCIEADEGFVLAEAEIVFFQAVSDLRYHYASLDFEKELRDEYSVAHGKSFENRRVGVGMVYIVPDHYCLFLGVVSALSAAIAAGNCCIVELLQTYRTLSRLLRGILPEALDKDTFAVVGERASNDTLSSCLVVHQCDEQAMSNPEIRPLNSPSSLRVVAVVDRTCDIERAATSIVSARFSFGGRSPLAPDAVLVSELVERPFLEAVTRETSKYMAITQKNDCINGYHEEHPKTRTEKKNTLGSVLSEVRKLGDVQIVLEGANGAVLRFANSSNSLLLKKMKAPVLTVHPVSSLDDAIDKAGCLSSSKPLLATIIFADAASAKYISQFVPAYVSYINDIPTSALVGPAPPEHCPVNLEARYTRAMFERPSPQFVGGELGRIDRALMMGSGKLAIARIQADAEALSKLQALSLRPLPPTRQQNGGQVGFFERGILLGAAMTVVPALLLVVGGTGYGLTWAWRHFKLRMIP